MTFVTVMIPDLGVGGGVVEDVGEVSDDDAEEIVDVVVDGLAELDPLDELGREGVDV